MTTVNLNGQLVNAPRGCTLADLLMQHIQSDVEVATAVNGQFVAKSKRSSVQLQPHDEVLTFQPITGG